MNNQDNISDFAPRIGGSASTVRRWARDGLLLSGNRLPVVSCRVSSPEQKDDLQSPVMAMEQYRLGAGIAVDARRNDRRPAVYLSTSSLAADTACENTSLKNDRYAIAA